MSDFEIEILDEDVAGHEEVQLPMNYLLIGELEHDDLKVYIRQDVYKALEEYALSDTAHELGTIILGNYSDALGKMNVVISDFIYAKYTDASASTLTFTHETWDYVHKEHEEKYPNTKIVGWQHTHPGYGIFLSNYDMFIQENFFNLPFQVAYVIDPVQHIRGFFQWKSGKVEKLKGFYIYDEVGKQIKIDQPKEKKEGGGKAEANAASTNKSSVFVPLILAVLFLMTIGLLISTVSLNKRYNRQIQDQENLERRISEQNDLISQQASELESMKSAASAANVTEPVPEAAPKEELKEEEPEEAASSEEADSPKEADRESSNKPENNKEKIENIVYFSAYTVEKGDTLFKICEKYHLDYASNYRIILSVNGIRNANRIFVGQTILLPISE